MHGSVRPCDAGNSSAGTARAQEPRSSPPPFDHRPIHKWPRPFWSARGRRERRSAAGGDILERDSGPSTQQDPIGIAGGLNLYGYAGADPINNSDPFGLCPPRWMCDLIGASAGQSAAEHYAAIAIDPSSSSGARVAATAGGLLASLWTPDTYVATATTLATGLAAGKALGAAAEGGAAAEARVTTEVSTRSAPGRDGATSRIIREKVGGRTNSVTHQVERNGEIIHQHQTHIGKYGGQRQFPDEWVQYKEIKKP
jgi:hypothetical protein